MVLFLLEDHIFGVLRQTFPFEHILQLGVPFSHVCNKEPQWWYSFLEYDPLLHISCKFVISKFLSLPGSLLHDHFVNPHKLNTIRTSIHLDIYMVHFVDEIHHIYHTTYDLLLLWVISFSQVKLDPFLTFLWWVYWTNLPYLPQCNL